MKICATLYAEKGWAKGMKWPYFVRRSTTTKMTKKLCEMGRPSIKFIEMADQTRLGMGKGWSKPGEATVSGLFSWQTEHSRTNFSISWRLSRKTPKEGGLALFIGHGQISLNQPS
jgi:hypothetical protein